MQTPTGADRWPWFLLAAWCALFVLAATFNAGGYRYGASDQAFYVPAVLHHLDAALFPRDWPMLAVQDRLNLFTPLAAAASRLTGVSLPPLFFSLYVGTLVVLFGAAIAIGSRLYQSRWTVIALAFALTLRHAVAMGAVNTLEGYMHPRMLAFAFGALGVSACLVEPTVARGRRLLFPLALVGLAAVCHPTTAMWFALWVGVAVVVAEPRLRQPAAMLTALAAAGGAWAVLTGPLAGRLTVMDAVWLSVLESKTYLFPDRWPVSGWLPALLTPLTGAILFDLRRRRGLTTAGERGIAAGAAVLFAVFLASIPFTAARVALSVQLQVPRTLWMVDLLAVAYLVWFLGEGARVEGAPSARGSGIARAARNACMVFLAASASRGAWVMLVQHPERAVAQVDVAQGPWNDAMRWIAANTERESWVLAPPGHAWQYGTSVRVAAARDVFLEEAKDTALAMYSRASAQTIRERIRRAAAFDSFTEDEVRTLGPDLLVTERKMNLPLLYDNGRFRVYRIRATRN